MVTTSNMMNAGMLSLLAFAGLTHARPLEGSRPNIILVMTDDQGMGDLSCMGNRVLKTPHIDSFYEHSTRFTDFRVSPTCAPTRSAMMNGRAPFKHGVTHTILQRERMALDVFTMPQALKAAGNQMASSLDQHAKGCLHFPLDRELDRGNRSDMLARAANAFSLHAPSRFCQVASNDLVKRLESHESMPTRDRVLLFLTEDGGIRGVFGEDRFGIQILVSRPRDHSTRLVGKQEGAVLQRELGGRR